MVTKRCGGPIVYPLAYIKAVFDEFKSAATQFEASPAEFEIHRELMENAATLLMLLFEHLSAVEASALFS